MTKLETLSQKSMNAFMLYETLLSLSSTKYTHPDLGEYKRKYKESQEALKQERDRIANETDLI